jgi:hypothetical protein
MSVLKNKRGLSKLEFYHSARRMRREITLLTLRDFGARARGKAFTAETGSSQPDGYFDEILDEFSANVRRLLRNLLLNITGANTIYPTNAEELQIRRNYQNAAIVSCEQLLQEILYCEDVLPVKASKFLPYIESIELEIKLLKGWRKSNTKIEALIMERKLNKQRGGDENR